MKYGVLVVALAALSLCGCSGGAGRILTEESAPKPLYLYLLLGQSNMAGRGSIGVEDTTMHPRVYALRANGAWGPAREPLHFDKPTVAGVGPGLSFGKAMAEAVPDVRIGLVPGAVGGTSIRKWVPGAMDEATGTRPYDDAIRRASQVIASQNGVLKGILWHQGESDSGSLTADQYEVRLVALVERLRAEFDDPNLPFVAAQLAPYYVDTHPGARNINEAIARLPGRLPHTAYVATAGLSDGGDGTHLDAASARALGQRFAEALVGLKADVSPNGRN